MRARLRKWWWLVKLVLAGAILFFIGRQFVRDLASPDLQHLSIRPAWLVLCGVLYLAGLGFSTWFWIRLLQRLGQKPPVPAAIRAYYLGHLGKYLPGKAWALALRAGLIRSSEVRVGLAAASALYEVLTTMAAGALFAFGWFLSQWFTQSDPVDWSVLRRLIRLENPEPAALDPRILAVLAGFLFAIVFLPIVPEFFNRLFERVRALFQEPGAPPSTPLPWSALAEGLLLTTFGWLLLGASMWAVLRAVLIAPPPLSWTLWGRYTAFLALAYVAGFAILLVPSGLGVREFFLIVLLEPDLDPHLVSGEAEARVIAVLSVIILRLVWTASELVIGSIVFWFPHDLDRRPHPG
jgi:uncharacterized membrane protein YbhN (UPF0104 family)